MEEECMSLKVTGKVRVLDSEDIRSKLFERLVGVESDMDHIISDTGNTVVQYKTNGGLFWVDYKKLSDRKTTERCDNKSK